MRLPSGTVWKIWDPAHQCHRASDRVLCGIRAENALGLSRESGPGGSTRAGWKATYRHSFQTSSFSRPLSLPTFLIFPSGAFLRAPLLPLTLPFSDSTSAGEMASEKKKNVPWIAPGDVPAADGNRTRLPTLGRSYSTNELQPRVSTMPVYHFDPAKATTFISFTDVPWAADRRRPVSSIRAVWEIRNVGCTPLPGPVQQQYRQGIRHSRAASWLLFPDQPQKEMGRCFCRLRTSERGPRFSRFVIAKCNLKNVEFYRFPGQDLCDSHLCRGCHPPILLSAVNFRQNGYCPRRNIREQNSDSVLCT